MALPSTPVIETMNVSDTRKQLSETLDLVRRHEARVVVEKSGIAIGALVSMDDLALLKRRDADRSRLLEVMAELSKGFEDVSESEVEAEVEKAIAEVNAERRARRNAHVREAS